MANYTTHFRPEGTQRRPFAAEWCGWKRSRGGQRGNVRDAITSSVVEEVSCKLCLRKIAAKAAPKAVAAPVVEKPKKLKKCDWCGGDGRYGNGGRFENGEIVGGGDSCDFCARCLGAGKVLR